MRWASRYWTVVPVALALATSAQAGVITFGTINYGSYGPGGKYLFSTVDAIYSVGSPSGEASLGIASELNLANTCNVGFAPKCNDSGSTALYVLGDSVVVRSFLPSGPQLMKLASFKYAVATVDVVPFAGGFLHATMGVAFRIDGAVNPLFGGGTVSVTISEPAPADETFRTIFFPANTLFTHLDSLTFTALTGPGLSGDFALDDIALIDQQIPTVDPPAVPESSTLALFGFGLLWLAGMRLGTIVGERRGHGEHRGQVLT